MGSAAMPADHLQDITHTIQLAVAPVFLLTALGTTLGVLASRLGRIVDRARRGGHPLHPGHDVLRGGAGALPARGLPGHRRAARS
jgi:Protein of unknown function (DUF2721)